MISVKGNIKFASAPASIPDGSTLTVKLEDTSRMDAPAVRLGTYVHTISGYKAGDVLSFEIKNANRPQFPTATISAVLNVGWAASGDKWIQEGDYLNDTQHPIELQDGKNDYIKNVEVIHYT